MHAFSLPVARYEPGAGFVLRQEECSLSCSGLDAATHEIWLLQLPIDVRHAPEFGKNPSLNCQYVLISRTRHRGDCSTMQFLC